MTLFSCEFLIRYGGDFLEKNIKRKTAIILILTTLLTLFNFSSFRTESYAYSKFDYENDIGRISRWTSIITEPTVEVLSNCL